jgi:hypothetical protein
VKIPKPRKPPRLNRTGTPRPALTTSNTGGSSTGWKNPVNRQITLTVAESVTRTAMVRVAGARRLRAEKVAVCPGVSKEPLPSRSHA